MRLLGAAAGLFLSVMGSLGVGAQVASCNELQAPIAATDVAWCALTQRPQFVLSPRPRYPDMLRSAGVSGDVIIEATVGVDGRVDMRSFSIQRSAHPLFTNAVKSSLPNWKFQPGEVDGKPVRARGALRFEFMVPDADTIPGIEVTEGPRITTSGLEWATGWRTPPRVPFAAMDTMRLFSVIEAATRKFASTCLNWSPTGKGDAPASILGYLRDHGSPQFPVSRCPPTYTSMIAYRDSLGRPIDRAPAGHVDPTTFSIMDIRSGTSDAYAFLFSVSHGMSTSSGRCQATWSSSTMTWEMACLTLSTSIH